MNITLFVYYQNETTAKVEVTMFDRSSQHCDSITSYCQQMSKMLNYGDPIKLELLKYMEKAWETG